MSEVSNLMIESLGVMAVGVLVVIAGLLHSMNGAGFLTTSGWQLAGSVFFLFGTIGFAVEFSSVVIHGDETQLVGVMSRE